MNIYQLISRELACNRVAEVLTENDASGTPATLSFSDKINSIEIWHDEDSPQEFTVNGITLKVASGGWRSPVGGSRSAEVVIPDAITCIITRLV